MNLKIKAALEVTGMIVVAAVVVAGVRSILSAATAAYGIDAVLNGIAFAAMATAAYVIVGLLYDQRVARLQYKQKLNEMVKK
jgi:hypothetical protein